MVETFLAVYFECKSKEQVSNILKYFDEERRPDFVEEVDESEGFLVELFEFSEFPEIEKENDKEYIMYFGDDDILFGLHPLFNHFNVTFSGAIVDAEDCEREYYLMVHDKANDCRVFEQTYIVGQDEILDKELLELEVLKDKIKLVAQYFDKKKLL
ncbi:hypothetical protein [Aliikangiella coralliicola]|uniref:Uncharacterized protein n=1 Tax=Aliikangiella coralliicola TaxID=2592383 RepID=A0A545U8I0_9GAMM|nr:hypothetical protein [Aliikangiella coralliicola]TQV85771.1 hypothetical protein FLL46_17760 [Aliikangiella coralliicola]